MLNGQLARISSTCSLRVNISHRLQLAPRTSSRPYSVDDRFRSTPKPAPSDAQHTASKATIMASDEAYSSFLDQANQDTGASKASAESSAATTKATDTDVPVSLQKVEQYYVSEADEPFEPISLKWSGSNMPSESTLGQETSRL